MQEKILSKRLIVFTEYQLFFHCNVATWCEDTTWESDNPSFQLIPAPMSPGLATVSLPNRHSTGMQKYAHLVSGYHGRQLTHENDALDAFTGVLTVLTKELNSPFIWGIPECSFSESMIWRTIFFSPSLRRPEFPSWSWLGWKASKLLGDLTIPGSRFLDGVEITPIVQWHHISAEGEQIQIGDTSVPYHKLPKFKHPAAFPDIPSDHFLQFWAYSAFLAVGRVPMDNWTIDEQVSVNYPVGIHQHDDEYLTIGKIWLNIEWRASQEDELEFIMVCRSILISSLMRLNFLIWSYQILKAQQNAGY